LPSPSSTLTSSTSRPVQLRMRPDLQVTRQSYQGREYWVIKDPLALKYFRFEDEEHALLSLLDGKSSLDQIRERFESQFAPQKISAAELHQLIGLLYRNGLLLSELPGQGDQLAERAATRDRQVLLGKLSNVLAMRFRGYDPDRLLTWLNRYLGWVFSLPALAAAILLMLSALLLIGAEFDVFRSRLPDFREFFAAKNWGWLALTLCVTKILHEIGHGLACKRFGGECHEMGLMLLVFTPCLYCNVTDSWMIPSRWRRAAVGAGGMYIELILASLATFLWWYTRPGIVNGLCLDVMFVCSVSTLIFNANPLMRYDGYYILSDLLEIPNLRQKAALVLQRKAASWVLGLPETPDPFLPRRRILLFALFSIASACYGWFVSLSIFWFLYRALEPWGLKVLGQGVACMMVVTLVILPAWRLAKFFYVPGRATKVKKFRAAVILGLSAAALVGILCVPLPYYVPCSFYVQPRGGTSVFVDVPGEVRQIHLQSGEVHAGDPLLTLESIDALLSQRKLESEREQLAAQLDALRQRAHTDDTAHLELAEGKEALAAVDAQLARRRQEVQKLTIVAPVGGIVVPAPAKVPFASTHGTLATWSGRPLDLHNVGAHLEPSTLLCRIAQRGELEAILAISQDELEFVRPDQQVDLFLSADPTSKRLSRIEHISQQEMQAAPKNLTLKSGGDMATRTDETGMERPVDVTYQASAPLSDTSGLLFPGSTGHAKIHAGYQPLYRRLWRTACRTFHFQM
jgi:putative peptide zinc metalloprotease protein